MHLDSEIEQLLESTSRIQKKGMLSSLDLSVK